MDFIYILLIALAVFAVRESMIAFENSEDKDFKHITPTEKILYLLVAILVVIAVKYYL